MGYTEFQGTEAVNAAIAELGLDTSRVHALQGDGVLPRQEFELAANADTQAKPEDPALG